MGHYHRDYIQGSNHTGKTPQIVVTLGVIVSLIVATSYLLKEFRLFSKSHRKPAVVEPSRDERLRAITPIDLNTASRADLLLLPGVTEERATQIIELRPLHKIDQLKTVSGIAEKRLAAIRLHVVIDPETLSQESSDSSNPENAPLPKDD